MSNLEIHECEDLGVTTDAYQRKASRCLQRLVETKIPTIHLPEDIEGENDIRISLTVDRNPPRAGIDKLPVGGRKAGQHRIREKMKPAIPASRDEAIRVIPFAGVPIVNPKDGGVTEAEMRRLLALDHAIVKPEPAIVGVDEENLTRECRLYTIGDVTFAEMLELGLISPKEYAEILAEIGRTRRELVVVMQRHLLGTEPEQGITVPYNIVSEKDKEVFEFIESVAA